MLEVSLNLTAVAAMLFGIVVPGFHIEVDGLNSPTAKPILSGKYKMGTGDVSFKVSEGEMAQIFQEFFHLLFWAKMYHSLAEIGKVLPSLGALM